MFVYEKGNSLNLTFKGSIPVENPEVVIKGFENGASLTVNSAEVVSVADAKEFEGKAKTFVYQKDGKLMITFRGVAGMEAPEVTLDETVPGTVVAVVNGTSVTMTYTADSVVIEGAAVEEPVTPVQETIKEEEPEVTPDEEPEEVVEE